MTSERENYIRLGTAATLVIAIVSGVSYIGATVRAAENRHSEDISTLVRELNDIGIKVVLNEAHLSAAVDRLDDIAGSLKLGNGSISERLLDHEHRILRLEEGK